MLVTEYERVIIAEIKYFLLQLEKKFMLHVITLLLKVEVLWNPLLFN